MTCGQDVFLCNLLPMIRKAHNNTLDAAACESIQPFIKWTWIRNFRPSKNHPSDWLNLPDGHCSFITWKPCFMDKFPVHSIREILLQPEKQNTSQYTADFSSPWMVMSDPYRSKLELTNTFQVSISLIPVKSWACISEFNQGNFVLT